MDNVSMVSSRQTTISLGKNFVRVALGLSLALLVANQAAAQYGSGGGTGGGGTGSGTYTAPPGGYSSAKGAGIGAGAAAGAGILFLTLHYHGRVTGCVQPGNDGLRLLDQKSNRSYALVPGDVYVKPGQLVQLKGKKSKDNAGVETFTAHKLLKDLGACGGSSSVAKSGGQPSR